MAHHNSSRAGGNISDLIHRVASSCLTHHLPCSTYSQHQFDQGQDPDLDSTTPTTLTDHSDQESSSEALTNMWEPTDEKGALVLERAREMEILTSQVFEAVSAMKRAYVTLQGAHCPWDPQRMRVADAAVVGELRRLARLRDRFRRSGVNYYAVNNNNNSNGVGVRELVAPYEAAIEDLRRELKAKEAEVEGLKERMMATPTPTPTPRGSGNGRKGRGQFGKRVGCSTGLGTPMASPTPELFETYMEEVKSASRSFTAHLLSLMRAAHWNLSAAARSIIENTNLDDPTSDDHHRFTIPTVDPDHAKHALESYITRKLFHGFENETFYLDGSLSSLLRPSEYRHDCFAQFRDMRFMDPAEILGILPTCHFGKFAAKKYLAIVHPKMEESLFGGVEQRRQVMAGAHPRTGFYREYLSLAKAIWMLHLLAFALDPSPSHFEASKGATFHPEYMESVVKMAAAGRVGNGMVVGFSVGPGFKLGNGSVVRARVYLVPRV